MAFNFDEQLPRIGTHSWKWDQYGDPDIIALGTADMDFRAADTIVDAVTKVAQGGCFNYHFKPETYYETVMQWFDRRHNWKVEKDWLLNAPGVWTALQIGMQTYCKAGDSVILQSPRFFPLRDVIERAGCHVVENPMVLKNGRFELDFADFEAKIAEHRPKLYMLINLQNPTGRVFTKEELLELNRICGKYGVLTLSDEVHANILFDGHVHYPAASISEEAKMNTIVITAASKAYNVMDLTYCVLVIPNPALREQYQSMLTGYSLDFAVNCFSVAGVTAAFGEETDPWLDALTKYLSDNLDFMMDYFARYIPRIKPIRPEGSYLVWLDCRDLQMNPVQLKAFFLQAHVGLTWGDPYGEAGNGFARLNIGCPRKTLREGLYRIREAVDSL